MFCWCLFYPSGINNYWNISFLCLWSPRQARVVTGWLHLATVSSLRALWLAGSSITGFSLAEIDPSTSPGGSRAGRGQTLSLLKLAKRMLVPYCLISVQDICLQAASTAETIQSYLGFSELPSDFWEAPGSGVCPCLRVCQPPVSASASSIQPLAASKAASQWQDPN